MKKQIILMDRSRMQRTLKRIAMQVWERLKEDIELVIIGLNERGYATALELSDNIADLLQKEVNVYRYEVSGNSSETPLDRKSVV